MAVSKFCLSLDIGKKVAKSLVCLDNPYLKPRSVSLTPLLTRKDGRVYNDFKEGLYWEICMGWVEDNWSTIQSASLIDVETQMSIMSQNDQRLTILIHNTFMSIFSTLHHEGLCCPVISVSPVWWRKAAGAVAPRVDGDKKSQYDANKKRSLERFKEIYGEEVLKELKQQVLPGQNVTDMVESVLIGFAVASNPQWVHEKLYYNSSHGGVLSAPGAIVKKESRHVEIKKLSDIQDNDEITSKDLLKLHADYTDVMKTKQAKRVIKKIHNEAERHLGIFGRIPVTEQEAKRRKMASGVKKKVSALDTED